MAKRKSESSVREGRVGGKEKPTAKMKIDYSDIPELSPKILKSMKRVGRPPLGRETKMLIAVRIEPKILDALRRLARKSGKGYQTLIHEVLEKYVSQKAA